MSQSELTAPSTGNNGVYFMPVDIADVKQLTVIFGGSGAVAHLKYRICGEIPTAAPSVSPTDLPASPTSAPTASPTTCPYTDLNFDSLTRGDYITDQLEDLYGVTITAAGSSGSGYTPAGAARVFDTNITGGVQGDPDLGSPNEGCGGPGEGLGGAPGEPYENCMVLGNVLIIQEENKTTPDDNAGGGNITFDFLVPVEVVEIAILDIDINETATVLVSR